MEYDRLVPPDVPPVCEANRRRNIHDTSKKSIGFGVILLVALAFAGYKSQVLSSQVELSSLSNVNVGREILDFDAGTRDHNYVAGTSYSFIREGRMVEPQRESTITLLNKRSVDIRHCSWQLSSRSGGGVYDELKSVTPAHLWNPTGAGDDTEIRLTFPSPGVFSFTSTCTFEDEVEVIVEDDITCFYVRRELRELSLHERNAFLDAFVVLMNVEDGDGQIRYGSHYSSLFNFEHIHLHAAGGRHLDHIHDGMGIATQHISMTMEFELALQSVNPSVTCPYWDYTIDSVEISLRSSNAEISDIFKDSQLFTPQWFGKSHDIAGSNGTFNVVTEGRFAYQEVPHSKNFTKRSPYGYLRAPWNINPSKYVTRYHKICGADPYELALAKFSPFTDLMWPTCDIHFKYTNTDEYSTWFDWVWGIGYLPHGPVHSWIGGVGGDCDVWSGFTKLFKLSKLEVHYLQSTAFANLKNAWRDYYIEFPEWCSSDTSYQDCMWKCKKNLTLDFEIDVNVTMKNPNYGEIIDGIMCDTAFWPGDHLEAGSPIEASFWPIHPTIDRLLQYKSIIRPFKNVSWDTNNDACIYSSSTNCEGHNQNDLTFWKSITYNTTINAFEKQHRSNIEVREAALSASLPDSYMLPYVYSNFNWSHCEAVDVYFKKV